MKKVNVPSASSPFVVFLFALLQVSATHTKAQADRVDPLLPVCKTVGGGSTYFGVDFCMSALGSDNRAHHDEGYGALSIIAVDLVAANATSTGAKITGLLKKAAGKEDDDASLLSCQALYSGILDLLPGCTAAINGGKFDRAALSLEKAASAANECEDQFRSHSEASPLTVENGFAFKLAKLAVALLRFAS
ncbi:hypothetical protein HU200_064857 [Digitaria exilis]|uniref:Pectinesterase inhibitor domain-containing protein n=1 Tax=Digitaria exilis TaxID=1010633 RepID=A0A835DXW3_9POAL|nr:hypothetical protein HU200_064857 [Digitaria exilis]